MLTKYDIAVSKEDIERVDTLRYAWKNLLILAKDVQDRLLEVQPLFKNDLTAKVEQFKMDSEDFVSSYQKVFCCCCCCCCCCRENSHQSPQFRSFLSLETPIEK